MAAPCRAASPAAWAGQGCPVPPWPGRGGAGALVSLRAAYPRPPRAAPPEGWPPPGPVPQGRLTVAVVLGASGSVITDALGPFEVFARCPEFFVYTVSPCRPRCSPAGWPWYPTIPSATWTRARRPSPTWSWSRPWSPRPVGMNARCVSGWPAGPAGARTCSVSVPGHGCWLPRACSTATGPPPTGRGSRACSAAARRWTGCAASATSRTARSPLPPG